MTNQTRSDEPVPGLAVGFPYQEAWLPVFKHLEERVRADIQQQRAAGKFVVYLSCPISARGGGYQATNTEIAGFIARRVTERLGDRFYVLNPALYQHQSEEGKTLVKHQAAKSPGGSPSLDAQPPGGGDYMRMWTRVLAGTPSVGPGLGDDFAAFYFVGPSDIHEFFAQGSSASLSTCVESYLARKMASSLAFQTDFGGADKQSVRDAFLRFYALRASAAFSKGSHDEWNILSLLNRARIAQGDVGEQISAYFDGRQVDPASAETQVSPGYATKR